MDIFDWLLEIIMTSLIANQSEETIPSGWDIARFVAWGKDFDGYTRLERMSLLKEFLKAHLA